MKTLVLAILGFALVIASCGGGSKTPPISKCEPIAQLSEPEEKVESLKRHNRW
jgi:hypothetical protein